MLCSTQTKCAINLYLFAFAALKNQKKSLSHYFLYVDALNVCLNDLKCGKHWIFVLNFLFAFSQQVRKRY